MKISVLSICLLLPLVASAQNPQVMNEADLQKMMQQLQQAKACMQNLDQSRCSRFWNNVGSRWKGR